VSLWPEGDFGKSYLAMNEMAKIARYPNKQVWYISPTYRMCKQIIWEPLKDELTRLNWLKKSNETDLTLTLVNGSKISLRGADNPDSLRGVSLDFVVFDEFAFIDEKAWTEVIRPTLSTNQGSAMFITTPCGVSNWAYDLFNKGKDVTNDQWESFSFTTLDGGYVTAEEIEQAKQDLDERTFRQEYLADFTTASNLIYYAFDRKQNVRQFTREVPQVLHIGLDFNVGQMSAVVFIHEGNIAYAIDEISLLSSNTAEMVNEIRNRYPKQKIIVYPDPAGAARKTSAASGVTDHSILYNAGFTVKAPNAHNPVRDGINAVNSKLCSADGTRTFFIDPKCKKTIESLEKHSYKENSSIPDKDSGFDHFSDALRYFIDYVFPVRRNIPVTEPRRFGHSIT
jgi:phage terminase large subunit